MLRRLKKLVYSKYGKLSNPSSTYYQYFRTLSISSKDPRGTCVTVLLFTTCTLFLVIFASQFVFIYFLVLKFWRQIFEDVFFYLKLLDNGYWFKILVFSYISLQWLTYSSVVVRTQGSHHVNSSLIPMSIGIIIFVYKNIPNEVNQPPSVCFTL